MITIEKANFIAPAAAEAQTEKRNLVRRCLLVASAAFALVATVTVSKEFAATALKAIGLTSSLAANSGDTENSTSRLIDIARIAILALAIIGVAASKPILYTASLVAEIFINTVQMMQAIKDKDMEKIVFHATILLVDLLLLTGIVMGSPEVLLAAAIINIVIMTGYAYKAFDKALDTESGLDMLDTFCYISLAAAGVVSSINLERPHGLIGNH